MDIVTVKNKFQIVIPQHVREQVHIEIGDVLEAGVENGKITFTPKSLHLLRCDSLAQPVSILHRIERESVASRLLYTHSALE
jgi:AbrB family looped-hinge helix DNA binding protein